MCHAAMLWLWSLLRGYLISLQSTAQDALHILSICVCNKFEILNRQAKYLDEVATELQEWDISATDWHIQDLAGGVELEDEIADEAMA